MHTYGVGICVQVNNRLAAGLLVHRKMEGRLLSRTEVSGQSQRLVDQRLPGRASEVAWTPSAPLGSSQSR